MSLNVSHSVVKKCHTFLPEFMQPPACVTCTPEWPGVKPYGSLKKLKSKGLTVLETGFGTPCYNSKGT